MLRPGNALGCHRDFDHILTASKGIADGEDRAARGLVAVVRSLVLGATCSSERWVQRRARPDEALRRQQPASARR